MPGSFFDRPSLASPPELSPSGFVIFFIYMDMEGHPLGFIPKPKLRTFVLISVFLHACALIVFFFLGSSRHSTHSEELVLSIRITPDKVTIAPDSNQAHTRPADISSAETKDTDSGLLLWQQGIETARRLLEETDIASQAIMHPDQHNSNIEAENLELAPHGTQIDSYREDASGNIIVVFRFNDGRTVCASMREPDPLNYFDEGSWQVLLGRCR